jgi:hypothetical protein
MRFIEYITEKRSHDIPKVGVVEALSKYRNDPDIYISYTDVEKLGINPTYGFETPLGIYFYPLKNVWKNVENNSIPFAGDRKWVWVVRAKDLLDLDKYNNARMTEDIVKLTAEFKGGKDFDRAYEAAKIDCKRYGSPVLTRGRFIFYLTHNLASWNNKQAVEWSRILRKVLGYKGVRDTKGIIHTNEPIQAIIFTLRDLEIVEKIANIRPDTNKRIIVKSIKEFFTYVGPDNLNCCYASIINQRIREYHMVEGINGSITAIIVVPKIVWSNISLDDFKYLFELRNINRTIRIRSLLNILEINKYRPELMKFMTNSDQVTYIETMDKAVELLGGRTVLNRIEEYYYNSTNDYVSYGGYLMNTKSVIDNTNFEMFKHLVSNLIFQYTDFITLSQLIMGMKGDQKEALGYLIGKRWSIIANGPHPTMSDITPSVDDLIKSFSDYIYNDSSSVAFRYELVKLFDKKFVEKYYVKNEVK